MKWTCEVLGELYGGLNCYRKMENAQILIADVNNINLGSPFLILLLLQECMCVLG